MTREEIEELKGLATSMGLYDDKNPCKRAVILGKAIEELEKEPSEDCIARKPLIDNWNCCADMLMGEGDAEVVMGWIFDAPSVTPTQEPNFDKIRKEIADWQTDIHDNEYDAESHDFVFERIYEIIDEQRARSEDKRMNVQELIDALNQQWEERLDKIRTEIDCQEKWLIDAGYNRYNVDIAFDAIKSAVQEVRISK